MLYRLLSAFLISFGLTLAHSAPAKAGDPLVYAVHGAAIDGYDVVAYFHSGTSVRGQMKYRVKWRGAIWYFSSAQNLERFESDPRAFAPRFGGYCAFAMASGRVSSVDPHTWRIVDGRLYMLHGPEAAKRWQNDIEEHVKNANRHWSLAVKK